MVGPGWPGTCYQDQAGEPEPVMLLLDLLNAEITVACIVGLLCYPL